MRNKCHWHQWTRPWMLLMHRTTHCKGELSSPKCRKCWVKNSCSRSINFLQKETLPTFVYWFSSRRKHLTYVGYIHLRREEIILYTKYKLISLFSQCFTLAHHIPNAWDPLWSKGANNCILMHFHKYVYSLWLSSLTSSVLPLTYAFHLPEVYKNPWNSISTF